MIKFGLRLHSKSFARAVNQASLEKNTAFRLREFEHSARLQEVRPAVTTPR